mmetsp:Transcript_38649/g.119479  ORF Transcript_38649/g.119479 Transcript_38649/m.119479 type:complete len:264 (+) Transcript_38649:749-1540(+)
MRQRREHIAGAAARCSIPDDDWKRAGEGRVTESCVVAITKPLRCAGGFADVERVLAEGQMVNVFVVQTDHLTAPTGGDGATGDQETRREHDVGNFAASCEHLHLETGQRRGVDVQRSNRQRASGERDLRMIRAQQVLATMFGPSGRARRARHVRTDHGVAHGDGNRLGIIRCVVEESFPASQEHDARLIHRLRSDIRRCVASNVDVTAHREIAVHDERRHSSRPTKHDVSGHRGTSSAFQRHCMRGWQLVAFGAQLFRHGELQ